MEDLKTQNPYIGRFSLHGHEAVEILAVLQESDSCNRITKYAYIRHGEIKVRQFDSLTQIAEDPNAGESRETHTVAGFVQTKYGNAYEVAEAALRTEYTRVGEVGEFVMQQLGYPSWHARTSSRSRLHQPERDGAKISLYLTAKDFKRSRRTSMKPGRAFKHMFDNEDPVSISGLAEKWIERSQPRNFTLKLGDTRADFRRAYCGIRAKARNPQTTKYRKNLATSCMHTLKVYDDDDGEGDMSPAEVFASGDFKVAWLETDEEHVAARVVFSNKNLDNRTHAPIYGICEQSLDELAKFLTDAGIKHGEEWEGLRLLHMTSTGSPVGPYLDCEIGGEISGDRIWLSTSGELAFTGTDGLLVEGGYTCERCEDRIHEDDAHYTDDGVVCYSCFNSDYVVTNNGDTLHHAEAEEVQYRSGGRSYWMWTHRDEAVYCDKLDEWWHEDSVTWSNDEDEAIPTHLMDEYPELFNDEEETE